MDLFTDVTQYQQLFVFFKETNAVSIVQCTMFPNLVNLGSFIRIRFKLIKVLEPKLIRKCISGVKSCPRTDIFLC